MRTRIIPKFIFIFLWLVLSSIPSAARPPVSQFFVDYAAGTIVISTVKHQLIYVKGVDDVETFSIAVGRQGRKWTGVTTVSRKVLNPAWAPPPIIRRDNPKLPPLIKPGPGNPLGVAVLVLGDGSYGIHGTNRDETIGTDASYGCFRMHNADILALFSQVKIGTVVYVQR